MKKFIVILLLISKYLPAQITDQPADTLLTSDSSKSADSLLVTDTLKSFNISVFSNLDNAKIYSDTTFIGFTPLKNYNIKAGINNLKIINPRSLQDWQNDNVTLNLFIDKDTTVNVDFKYFYFINTDPFDAKVFKNDSLLGETPLRFFKDNEITGSLLIKKKNYKDYFFDLSTYNFETGANITLKSKGIVTVNDIVYKDRSTQFKTKRSLLPILGTAAAAITGCVLSINFKNNANYYYDRYLINGNSTELEESHSNDTYFVISVVMMQAAIGGLIYFLFFDK